MTERPDDDTLRAIESTAVDLARLAGAEAAAAFGRILAVLTQGEGEGLGDPVSEVGHRVAALVGARLADAHPDHDVLGEEIDSGPPTGADFVWVIDPIDGTTNFVNGFPLFAASVGVLYRGRPVVGAVWCSATHALRPGVYHGRAGGPLRFEEDALVPHDNAVVRRRLAGQPDTLLADSLPWEIRKTGSAALQCCFVAAGLLRVARFDRANAWDVAGGIPLVEAAGGVARQAGPRGWEPLERLTDADGDPRTWRNAMVVGTAEAVDELCRLSPRAG